MHHLPNRQMVKESVKTVTVTPRLFLFDRAQSYRTLAADQANWKLGIPRHHVKSIFRHLSTSRQIRRQPSCNIWNDRHRFKNPRYRIETGTSFAPITKFATKVFQRFSLSPLGQQGRTRRIFFPFRQRIKMTMFVVTRSCSGTGRNVAALCGAKWRENQYKPPHQKSKKVKSGGVTHARNK